MMNGRRCVAVVGAAFSFMLFCGCSSSDNPGGSNSNPDGGSTSTGSSSGASSSGTSTTPGTSSSSGSSGGDTSAGSSGSSSGGPSGTSSGNGSSSSSSSSGGSSSGGVDGGGSSSSGGDTEAGAQATFTQLYTTVLKTNCAMKCHAAAAKPDGGLDLSTQAIAFTNLVGKAATGMPCLGKGMRVVAGNSAMSILYSKVSSATPVCGVQMPKGCKGAMCLTTMETDLIKAWIDSGAMNN